MGGGLPDPESLLGEGLPPPSAVVLLTAEVYRLFSDSLDCCETFTAFSGLLGMLGTLRAGLSCGAGFSVEAGGVGNTGAGEESTPC